MLYKQYYYYYYYYYYITSISIPGITITINSKLA